MNNMKTTEAKSRRAVQRPQGPLFSGPSGDAKSLNRELEFEMKW